MKLFSWRKPADETPRSGPNGRLGLGLLLIATGRAAGFAQFGASVNAYLASLAPLLAFAIVAAGLLAASGARLKAAGFLLLWLCNFLAPAVIADLFCILWKRRDHWALYANLMNCAQWIMFVVVLLLLLLVGLAMSFGVSPRAAAHVAAAAAGLYLLWLQWFMARHALNISRGRAMLVMLAVVFGTGLLTQLPSAIAGKDRLGLGMLGGDMAQDRK